MNKVVEIHANLTSQDRLTAEFWEGLPDTAFPPGIAIEFTNQQIEERGVIFENAIQVLLRVSQALKDAGISAWATKSHYDSVRPITSIQQYYWHEDLPDGTPGKEFQPYLPTPNFAEFVSGHSTLVQLLLMCLLIFSK